MRTNVIRTVRPLQRTLGVLAPQSGDHPFGAEYGGDPGAARSLLPAERACCRLAPDRKGCSMRARQIARWLVLAAVLTLPGCLVVTCSLP